MRFAVVVEVTGLDEVADPQGQTIERALPALGFAGVEHVRVGKVIRYELEAEDEAAARATSEELCRRLLANPVIEQAAVSIAPSQAGQPTPAAQATPTAQAVP